MYTYRIDRVCLRTSASRRPLAACCAFNFSESSRVNLQQGRRNRAVEKKHEQELRSIVHGLCAFNGKQLQAVSHLLSEEHKKQIRIAMDIPPTNQGRRRQEGLVLKLLRADADNLDLAKLAEAVGVAQKNNLPYSDNDVEQQLQIWIEGLLDNEQEVVDEVYQLLQDSNMDWQQLRTWVRQIQQHQQQQAAGQQQAQSCNSSSEGSAQQQTIQRDALHASSDNTAPTEAAAAAASQQVVVHDPEVAELLLELAQKQQKQRQSKGKQGKGQGSSAAVSAARRSIRKMLKPLAVAQVAS